MPNVPTTRIRVPRDIAPHPQGRFVLYWMIASRRLTHSFALDRAVALAQAHDVPLLVFEPLRVAYPFACDRFHTFVLQGMAEHAEALERRGVTYFPYVEPEPGAGSGLLAALASHALAVVTDDHPWFHYPAMLDTATQQLTTGEAPRRLEIVDGNGLLPLRACERLFHRAYDFRRYLQRNLTEHVLDDGALHLPSSDPLAALPRTAAASLPVAVTTRWDRADPELLSATPDALARLPIDHSIGAVETVGGSQTGAERLHTFMRRGLSAYDETRNRVQYDGTTRLSPYLHFGHVGTHQVLQALVEAEGWDPSRLGEERKGKRTGWWGMSESAEALLDQVVTWRELGFNRCAHALRPDGAPVAGFDTLPEWARLTLEAHADDARPHLYTAEQLEQADTHDPLWNAAQNQLREEGRIHNYLRMLWGKKALEWTAHPRDALELLLSLNDRYAIDGRDPNSVSGVTWIFGRYDRAWGPERAVFGKVRYMSSASTARKMRVGDYIERFSEAPR